jgi:hypothetical protein
MSFSPSKLKLNNFLQSFKPVKPEPKVERRRLLLDDVSE